MYCFSTCKTTGLSESRGAGTSGRRSPGREAIWPIDEKRAGYTRLAIHPTQNPKSKFMFTDLLQGSHPMTPKMHAFVRPLQALG